MNVLGPVQKLVELVVLLVMPAMVAVEWVELEEPLRQQIGPEEPLVPGPYSLAVVVLEVHGERVELLLRRWLFIICLRRGSVLYFYDRPVKKQVVGARKILRYKNKIMSL